MREIMRLAGGLLFAMGVSGTIDRLAVQPLFGAVLNVVNRQVIPRLDVLTGHEVYANLVVAVAGALVFAIAGAGEPAGRGR